VKFRALGSFWEWDEVRLIEAEAGRYLSGPDVSVEDLEQARRIREAIPRLEAVEVTAGDSWFGVSPGPDQPIGQPAFAVMLRMVREVGWRVSNIRRRFSPTLAMYVARRYGRHSLGWKNSWIKIIAPAAVAMERRLQRYPEALDNMLVALANEPPVMPVETFVSLSAKSISQAMPPREAAEYFKARR